MKKILVILLIAALLVGLIFAGKTLYNKLSSETDIDSTSEPGEARRHNVAASEPTPLPAPPEESAPAEEPEPEPEAQPEAETPEATAPLLSADLTADFRVLDESGNYVRLSDYFGKPIVVNFWATWCPPCRGELPHFEAAFQNYGDRVQFMMVDLTDGGTDTVESATAFRNDGGYTFPLFFDVDFSGVDAYSVNAIPVTLFIRADGSLLYQQIGMLDEQTLLDKIEELLAS